MALGLGLSPIFRSVGLLQQLSIPLWQQYGATQYIDFTDYSKIQPGATSTDINGWDDTTASGNNLTQPTATNQPTWVQGYDPIGPDLVTNGTFDTDLSGWTVSNPTYVFHDSGAARLYDPISNNLGQLNQEVFTIGKYYEITFEVVDYVSGIVDINNNTDLGLGITSNGVYKVVIKAELTQLRIKRSSSGGSYDFKIDNIKVCEAVENDSKSHALFDGDDDYLTGLPTQAGDFTYVLGGCSYETSATRGFLSNGAQNLSVAGNEDIRLQDSSGTYVFGKWSGVEADIILVREGTEYRLYIDGVLLGSTSSVVEVLQFSRLGRDFSSIGGKIKTLQVYPSALNETQIAKITTELNS